MYTRRALSLNDNSMLSETLLQLDTVPGHAYLIYGDRQEHIKELEKYFEKKEITTDQNPDVFLFSKNQFGIGEVRTITSIVSRTNTRLPNKYITISTDAFTVEAQNALLKTIEEPDSPTIFFILVPEGSFILETVLSRVQVIRTKAKKNHDELIASFLQSGFVDRMKLLDVFYIEQEGDKKPVLQKGRLSLFLTELEKHLSSLVLSKAISSDVFLDYTEITQYVLDRSSSSKQILEYISMRVPMIK